MFGDRCPHVTHTIKREPPAGKRGGALPLPVLCVPSPAHASAAMSIQQQNDDGHLKSRRKIAHEQWKRSDHSTMCNVVAQSLFAVYNSRALNDVNLDGAVSSPACHF